MNQKENTISTTGSSNESKEEQIVSDEKMLSLLKLVYYERKSIKQSSKYLQINYNSAKRIIKNFRRNKNFLDNRQEENLDTLVNDIKHKNENTNKFKKEELNKESQLYNFMMKQIKQYELHLIKLNDEIRQSQSLMLYVCNCATQIINGKGKY